ncbi:MAG: hypothetical protein ABIJ03_01600 [Patescibacteria group bacterium]|nr:hypothetical protein [Patescibacteria group bacterium]
MDNKGEHLQQTITVEKQDGNAFFSNPRIPNTAELPPESVQILKGRGMDENGIRDLGWHAVPTLHKPHKRLSKQELATNGQVDAVELLSSLLGDKRLVRTLRTMDLSNGCGMQCDTCLADAALPAKQFSYESLERLFLDNKFLEMLQPDSLRIGSSGEISNNPRALDIVKMILTATKSLDMKRMEQEGKHHQIKVFTNYRHITEQFIDGLIDLAKTEPRLSVCISLPLNKIDSVNRQFDQYALSKSDIFGPFADYRDEAGLIRWAGRTTLRNVLIQDVRHTQPLYMGGRVLSNDQLKRIRDMELDEIYYDSTSRDYGHRGFAKTYLNPDGLWCMVHGTGFTSHTDRSFTIITPQNLDALSYLPYHYDFPTPPNWPGGKAVNNVDPEKLRTEDFTTQTQKPRTIVK